MWKFGFVLAVIFLTTHSHEVQASEVFKTNICTRPSEKITIRHIREIEGSELPCSIVLSKDGEADQTLWQVKYERNFCERKKNETLVRLRQKGWICDGSTAKLPVRANRAHPKCNNNKSAWQGLCGTVGGRLLSSSAVGTLMGRLRNLKQNQNAELSLVESISLVTRSSSTIQDAVNVRIRTILDFDIARDEFRPDLDIQTTTTRSNLSGWSNRISAGVSTRLPTGAEISAQAGGQFDFDSALKNPAAVIDLNADIRQPLLRGGGIDVNLINQKLAKLNRLTGEQNFETTIISVVSNTIRGYRNLALAQSVVDVAERTLRRDRERTLIDEKLFAAGRISRFEVQQNKAQVLNSEIALTSARVSQQDAQRTFVDLLSIETPARIVAKLEGEPRPQISLTEAKQLAFANRRDLKQAHFAVRQADLGAVSARNEQSWQLDAVAGVNVQRSVLPRGTPGSDLEYVAGLELNAPFGDVARRQLTKRAELDIDDATRNLGETKRVVTTLVENLIQNIESQKQLIRQARLAVELAKRQLKAVRKRFDNGLSSAIDVTTLADNLLEAENAVLLTEVAYQNTLTDLDEAMGTTIGTWNINLRNYPKH